VRYHEPHIGKAAVKVLEAAGFEVALAEGRSCCGRPAFSTGRLDVAVNCARKNAALLGRGGEDTPIVFLEPSCFSMFVEDYAELGVEGAEALGARCVLFEEFIGGLLEREPDALSLRSQEARIAIHEHCHTKALTEAGISAALAGYVEGAGVQSLKTGCCGMAGAFGAKADKYDLSLKVAEPLLEQLRELKAGTKIVASGTSCRHQIEHLHSENAVHMAELLAGSIVESTEHSGV
jgi:Fe-S oxidoreductase